MSYICAGIYNESLNSCISLACICIDGKSSVYSSKYIVCLLVKFYMILYCKSKLFYIMINIKLILFVHACLPKTVKIKPSLTEGFFA